MGLIPARAPGGVGHPRKQVLCWNQKEAFMFAECVPLLGHAFPLTGAVCKWGHQRGLDDTVPSVPVGLVSTGSQAAGTWGGVVSSNWTS